MGSRIVEGVADGGKKVDAPAHADHTTHIPTTHADGLTTTMSTTSDTNSQSIPTGYMLIPEADMRRMDERLTTAERKIDMLLKQVKHWVKKELETKKALNTRLDGFEICLNLFLSEIQTQDWAAMGKEIVALRVSSFDLFPTPVDKGKKKSVDDGTENEPRKRRKKDRKALKAVIKASRHTFDNHMTEMHEKVKGDGSFTASELPSQDGNDPSSESRSVSAVVPSIGGGTLIASTSTTLLSAPAPVGATVAEIEVASKTRLLWILELHLQLPLISPRASRMP
ncbi:hypothetical protein HAX54_047386 [Datura stramonium]|uniref:Uncharacterized protein n=1 Tax=Datura stramonium TaxID=4076 RepID=A0ABS8WLZ2_DATST|nr:hypothetical protein [Datura stramonium]